MDKKYIRFIDSSYNTLFYVPDGGEIKVHSAWDGKDQVFSCKYLDEYHVSISGNCYHICQFAELMERNGNTYEPVKEIGDLDFYQKRFYDRDNIGSDGKIVPYYELLAVKRNDFEYKFNYCLAPTTEDKAFFLFKEHAYDTGKNERFFAADIESICTDEKLAARLHNIVQSIREEESLKIQSRLPERCYGVLPSSGEIIIISRGETGYYKTDFSSDDVEFNKQLVDEYNEKLGVSKAQAAAMSAGSMFGWNVPGANPECYDENGVFKKDSLLDKISAAEKEKQRHENAEEVDKATALINEKKKEKEEVR